MHFKLIQPLNPMKPHSLFQSIILSFSVVTLWLLCGCTISNIAKPDTEDLDRFPSSSYSKVLYFHHESTDLHGLRRSDDLKLVGDLYAPNSMVGMEIESMEEEGWVRQRVLTEMEIRQLRNSIKERGRFMRSFPCSEPAYNKCFVFIDQYEKIVGSIYFCPKGLSIEARPTLRPGEVRTFMWTKKRFRERFEEFVQDMDRVGE